MARRIEIELTSTRDDGSWTWRAAGAREPKGVVEASKLPGTPSTGDVLRVEVEIGLDGTDITAVLPPKEKSKGPETLQLIGRDLRDDELVTSKLVGKRGRRDRDDDDRRGDRRGGRGRDGRPGERGRGGPGGRDGRPGGGGPGGDRGRHPRDDARRGGGGPGDRGPRRDGGGGGGRGERSDRPRRRPVDEKPRPKRLRAQRTHRRAVLDTLEAHERPIADEVLRGGIPAVRQAVEKQNAQARAEGRPEVDAAQLEALAERLLPRLRAAEWRDRADAALADLDELDLRDLRTVVVAADSAAKDDEAKALAAQLKEGLERRIEADHTAWLAELGQLLDDGRVVRALRVSSRPPKAGVPLPPELATRLAESTTASLTADTFPDRWETVLDALSLSPVHARVAPESIPAEPSDELKATVAGFGERVPLVAQAFGVEPTAAPRRPRRGPRGGGKGGPGGGGGARAPQAKKPVPPPPPVETAAAEPAQSAPVGDADVAAEATEVTAAEETAGEVTAPEGVVPAQIPADDDVKAPPAAATEPPVEPEPIADEAAPEAQAAEDPTPEPEPVADEAAEEPTPEVPAEAAEGDATGTEAEDVVEAPAVDAEPETATEVPVEADPGDVTGTEAVEVAPSPEPAGPEDTEV